MAQLSRLADLRLSAQGIQLYERLFKHSQLWPLSQLQEFQVKAFRELIIRAYEGTDYYRELLWNADVDPYDQCISLQDFTRIPILEKAEARANRARLINPSEVSAAFEARTSGTTGQVFSTYISTEHWAAEQATVWRHWKWLGYDFRDRMAIIRSYVPKRGEPLWKLDRIRNFFYFSAYHLTADNARRYLEELIKWRPVVLRGYPSSLYILACAAIDAHLTLPRLKGILTASETLLPHYRSTIERAFGARVFDWYGQGECTVVFTECEFHEGMHANPEYGVVELLRDPQLPQDERLIVGTCLRNHAMPLIRYKTGDVATVGESDQCKCGRSLPLIKAIRGRSDALLFTPDGRLIPSVNLYTMMYELDGVLEFQFFQDDIQAIAVMVRTNGDETALKERLLEELRRRLGDLVRIEIAFNVPFIQSAEGKKEVVVSRVRRPA